MIDFVFVVGIAVVLIALNAAVAGRGLREAYRRGRTHGEQDAYRVISRSLRQAVEERGIEDDLADALSTLAAIVEEAYAD